jgi:hypothetical protein
MLIFRPEYIMYHIKGFEMIPKIFERPKIIIDYKFQAEQDLDAILLPNQNSCVPPDFSLDLMSFALRCYEIILNNSGDIFRTHLSQRVYVAVRSQKYRNGINHQKSHPAITSHFLTGLGINEMAVILERESETQFDSQFFQ